MIGIVVFVLGYLCASVVMRNSATVFRTCEKALFLPSDLFVPGTYH